jgi:hypothetical protein
VLIIKDKLFYGIAKELAYITMNQMDRALDGIKC